MKITVALTTVIVVRIRAFSRFLPEEPVGGYTEAQFGREVFCPWRPLEVRKPWHARTFAAAELAASMTLKS